MKYRITYSFRQGTEDPYQTHEEVSSDDRDLLSGLDNLLFTLAAYPDLSVTITRWTPAKTDANQPANPPRP